MRQGRFGFLGGTASPPSKKPHGVPERTRRKQKHRRVAIQASIDGHSIDDRDPCIMTRTTFRHWETDLMLWWM